MIKMKIIGNGSAVRIGRKYRKHVPERPAQENLFQKHEGYNVCSNVPGYGCFGKTVCS